MTRRRLGLLGIVVATLLLPLTPTRAFARSADAPAGFDLPADERAVFEAVLATVPEASCLSVGVGGTPLLREKGERPLVPASTLKLVTALVALERLGDDHRFVTEIRGPRPEGGVVHGDLGLVGGGDPLLATDAVIEHRGLEDLHPTRLDLLADAVVDAGVRKIEGRVLGDESRYDSERTVPGWPGRFVDQEQSGPLSALTVDDGYEWDLDGGRAVRRRSGDPARSAAAALTDLLRARGVEVTGEAESGPAPAVDPIAEIESARLADVAAELLLTSDNQTGELLVKELGHTHGGAGSTEAGVRIVDETLRELGLDHDLVIVDGSGLDPRNRLSCDTLVDVLDLAGGSDGVLSRGLPIAGESGTLRGRFVDTPLEGLLRAKTGRLNGVTALAGYVPLASGETATFAFLINDHTDEADALRSQAFVTALIHATTLPCDDVTAPVVLPDSILVGPMGTLSLVPLQPVVVPGLLIPLQVLHDRQDDLVDACLVRADAFEILFDTVGDDASGTSEPQVSTTATAGS